VSRSPGLLDVPVAVLAGGLATRLGGLAERRPKSLLEVAGRPFVDHQMALLRRRGLRRVVLLVGHLGEQIMSHVGDGSRYGLEIDCVDDGTRPLGTAGALRQASERLGPLFFALYGDSYADLDFAALLAALEDEKHGVMAVLANAGRWDRSNVELCDERIIAYHKHRPGPEMRHIDFGVSLLRNRAFADLPVGEPADLGDLYTRLVEQGRLSGLEVCERFFEIGSPAGLDEARRVFAEGHPGPAHARRFLAHTAELAARLDADECERLASLLLDLRRRGGRLFVLGVGGGAGHASHAVADFRKLCGLEAYSPADNVSELTARINDDGWDRSYADWLQASRLRREDFVLVFSVGGGDRERGISANLVSALEHAQSVGATIAGVIGRDGGFTAGVAAACVVVPTIDAGTVTPQTEAFQAVVWHLLASHPALQVRSAKWESTR